MDIRTAVLYADKGYRVRRYFWRHCGAISGKPPWIDKSNIHGYPLFLDDFLAEDWEIIKDNIINDYGLEVEYEDTQEKT